MSEVLDCEPRLRRFLELRAAIVTTHWSQRPELKEKPSLEFDEAWRAKCQAEWRRACIEFEDYAFWTFGRPEWGLDVLCWNCESVIPGSRIGRSRRPLKFCCDLCRTDHWRKSHKDARAVIEERYRENKRRREIITPVDKPAVA